jgi:hypothetical protein
MLFLNGIMVNWKKTSKGARISMPRTVFDGSLNNYVIYDFISSKILSPA